MNTTLEDRIAGVLIGQAAGDALGAPYEFRPAIQPQDAVMAAGGLGNWEPGEWTDDTQQAVLVALTKADPYRVAQSLIDWYSEGPPDVGGTTSASLSAGLRAREHEGASWYQALLKAARNVNGSTNGSLMRTSPVALAYLGDPTTVAARASVISQLTHAHVEATEACVIWSVLIERAVREGGPLETGHVQDAISYLPKASHAFWEQRAEWALSMKSPRGTDNMRAATALMQALSAIWRAPDLEGALRLAVSYGGDTDTVAAIAGGLLGALHGASAVPQEWLKVLHGWPGLDAEGLRTLALATVPEGVLS